MPINFGDIFIPKGKNPQTPVVSLESSSSLDGKEKIVINLPKQYTMNTAQPVKIDTDITEQNRRIPWSTIPFVKPILLPKEVLKAETINEQVKKPTGTISGDFKWTTTKVKQKKKELNMFSPSSY